MADENFSLPKLFIIIVFGAAIVALGIHEMYKRYLPKGGASSSEAHRIVKILYGSPSMTKIVDSPDAADLIQSEEEKSSDSSAHKFKINRMLKRVFPDHKSEE